MKYHVPIVLLALMVNIAFGQSFDTMQFSDLSSTIDALVAGNSVDSYDDTDDFSPMLFFMFLALMGIILVAIGFGIVLTVLVLLFVFGMVSFGVLSTSIIVGLHKKSVAKGFRVFIVLGSSVLGLLGGALTFWLFNMISKWCTSVVAIIWGSCTGLMAGFGFGLLAFYIIKRLTMIFKEKLMLEY